MFRIRRIHDDNIPIDKEAIAHVQNILRTQFGGIAEREILKLPEQLRDPLKYRFRSILLVADDLRGRVKGFALFFYVADLNFCYLDYISTAQKSMGRGIGGALYARVRDESHVLNTMGLFFECLPDDPALCSDPAILKENASRLRFYERYGARPVINTAYETPVKPGDDCPPYLVYDDLRTGKALSRKSAREVVRAILERKYGSYCPSDYVEMVVESFKDDPVLLREPRYRGKESAPEITHSHFEKGSIALVVNDQHQIHHVHERGYVESPVRIDSILKQILPTDLFQKMEPRRFSEDHIKAVHESRFVDYLKTVCMNMDPGSSVYPYVFPIRNAARPPRELPIRAGYYCIDTFTPLNRNAYLAARRGVDCTLTAVQAILRGYRFAYALIRPPGHHAERRSFGGFCYFNSAAVAAHFLSVYGKVAVLDIDYHHGNGTQDIFYDRSDVLTVSIHAQPRLAYPYFSGFEDEKGVGMGNGCNVNIPLPEHVDGKRYGEVLERALKSVKRFQPKFLIVAFGLDTAQGDPTGTWSLRGSDFESNGRMIGSTGYPTLVVQEGGYRTRYLGVNARHFFVGLLSGFQGMKSRRLSMHS